MEDMLFLYIKHTRVQLEHMYIDNAAMQMVINQAI